MGCRSPLVGAPWSLSTPGGNSWQPVAPRSSCGSWGRRCDRLVMSALAPDEARPIVVQRSRVCEKGQGLAWIRALCPNSKAAVQVASVHFRRCRTMPSCSCAASCRQAWQWAALTQVCSVGQVWPGQFVATGLVLVGLGDRDRLCAPVPATLKMRPLPPSLPR